MVNVTKKYHFHALETGIRTNLALEQNFVSSINEELDWVNYTAASSSSSL